MTCRYNSGYTSAMKTAISIPDRTFREGEAAARALKVSRSELYRRALEAFLVSMRTRDVTATYDAAFNDAESKPEVRFRRRAARKVLAQVEWDD